MDAMPPVMQQAARGTCVSAAVVAMVEYYEDCHHRLSVQFLTEAIRRVERSWVKRNMDTLRANGRCDDAFESIYRPQLSQIRLIAKENGFDSAAAGQFIDLFESSLEERLRESRGTLIRSAFSALEKDGVCRHSLWPYAGAEARAALPIESLSPFPPGSEADAKKHRIPSEQLYMLRSPNNVDEIKGFISGANSRRPMPVAVVLTIFEGLDGETFSLPRTETADGVTYAVEPSAGEHGVLLVGYEDDPSAPGGGWFTFRNSWGEHWGRKGYGRASYAYITLFCREAGTILEDMADYIGDGYVNLRSGRPHIAQQPEIRRKSNIQLWIINALVAAVIFLATVIGVLAWVSNHLPPPRHRYRHHAPHYAPQTVNQGGGNVAPTTTTTPPAPAALPPSSTAVPPAVEPSPALQESPAPSGANEPVTQTEPAPADNPPAGTEPTEKTVPEPPAKPVEEPTSSPDPKQEPEPVKAEEPKAIDQNDSPPDFYVEGDLRWRMGEDL